MAPRKDSRFVTGYHAVEEYLLALRAQAGAAKNIQSAVLYVAAANKRAAALAAAARAAGIPVRHTGRKNLDELPVSGGRHGLVLEIRAADSRAGREAESAGFEEFLAARAASAQSSSAAALVLALDGVTDVHNLGALLRSADLFCAQAVIIPGRGSAKDSDIVAKISSGASAFVPLFEVTNLVRALRALKDSGFWVCGADMKGQAAPETDLGGNTALVLGSEGKGLSRLVRETCDRLISIPAAGHVDSFNVSVAGGILMYEIRRQQKTFTPP
ncbi:MAG: 23S rRNA (guanosine(2251)-2'-O)-methyltransferase RlmB [Spirochaetales bacterium]|jgi:23S rRNA (guanosine2251-2'-O)-methyltransferase|nr:23S rRNA (guanosine(2251)-2'-O)-methyltransferase RlmB [Spirochaetales bacterium]